MNRFFQALLSRFLRENLLGNAVRDEFVLHGILAYSLDHNPKSRKTPAPRPDFVVYRGRQVVAVLDAKYRDLWQHDLPRECLYQLAIYALSPLSKGMAAILYPTEESSAREARIEISDPASRARLAEVALRPVDLKRLDLLLAAATHRRHREAFALELATGRSG